MIRQLNSHIQNNYLIRGVKNKQLGGGNQEEFKNLLRQQNEQLNEKVSRDEEESSFRIGINMLVEREWNKRVKEGDNFIAIKASQKEEENQRQKAVAEQTNLIKKQMEMVYAARKII